MISVTEVTVAAILEIVSTLVTSAIAWMADFLSAITASPVLTIFVIAVPLVGLGVGILKRLIGVRG